MTKTHLVTLPLALLALAVIPAGSNAQQQPGECPAALVSCASTNGPSYKVTSDWILSTLADVGGSDREAVDGTTGDVTYSNFSMDDCHLKFGLHVVNTFRSGRTIDFSQQVDVPLASVNVVKKGSSNYFTSWGSGPGEDLIFITGTEAINFAGTKIVDNSWKEWNSSFVRITIGQQGVDAQSYAQRLQRAFVHAAALCRAQAAQHPSNEPF